MKGFNINGSVVFNEDPGQPFGGAVMLRISRDLLGPIAAYIDSQNERERQIWGIEVVWLGLGEITGWRVATDDDEDDDICDSLVRCFEMKGCRSESRMPSLEAH